MVAVGSAALPEIIWDRRGSTSTAACSTSATQARSSSTSGATAGFARMIKRAAGWRIPALLLSSGSGMAIGGWIGGVFYDTFGYYGPAFLAAIIANLLNFAIVATLFVLLPSRADLAHVRGRARDGASSQALTAGIEAGTAWSSRAARLRVR
jgi:hypothetical protein